MDGQTPRKSLKRRLFRLVIVLVVLTIAALVALPWLLGTPPGRAMIVSAVNKALAPSKVAINGVALSWAGSTRLDGLTLFDGHGKMILSAESAVLDRGLVELATDRRHLGTLTVTMAKVDIERRLDGTIDLIEALTGPPVAAPVTKPTEPEKPSEPTDVTLKVVSGTLKLRSPELAEPILAESLEMEARVPSAAGQKVTWKVRLAKPPGGTDAETLGIDGDYDLQAAATPDLSLAVKGARWPLALAPTSGLSARGRFDGSANLGRSAGTWVVSGDAKFLELDAQGPTLSGDRLTLDQVAVGFDVSQSGSLWVIRKMRLESPVAKLDATASIGSDGRAAAASVDGQVDLAGLAKHLPHALRLREGLTLEKGDATLKGEIKTENGVQTASIDAKLSDLVARDAAKAKTFTLRDPATVTGRGTRKADDFALQAFEVKSGCLDVTASGDLTAGVKLAGSVDLAKLEAQFHDVVDFGTLALAGKGRMAGDYKKTAKGFVGRYAVEVKGLSVAGPTASPIVRDDIRLDASANGQAAADGLPNGWENLRLNVKSSQETVAIAGTNQGDKATLNATASVPLTLNAHDGRVDLKAVGRWNQAVGLAEFDEFRVKLSPTDPAYSDTATVAFATRGTFDLTHDDLKLTPLPVAKGRAVGIGDGNLAMHGWWASPLAKRSAEVFLQIDPMAADGALAYWYGMTPHGLGGAFTTHIGLSPADGNRLNVAVTIHAPEFSRAGAAGQPRTPEPLGVIYTGTYDPASDKLAISRLSAASRYASLDATGSIDAVTTTRVADLSGMLSPDFKTLSAIVAASTEPGASLTGNHRAFRIKGPLSGDSLAAIIKGLDAEVGIDLTSAQTFGMKLGPAPIVVKVANGTTSVDPINTTLNNGQVALKPALAVDAVQGIALQFLPDSSVKNAEINDDVSKTLLRYVAPVLDDATHVHGKINVAISQADIPITGPPSHMMTLTGDLSFEDVTFAPGKFASQLFTLVGKPNEQGLKLSEPIHLSVANGRVIQKGLEIPVRPDAKVAIEGSVGFDETLDLRATVPVTAKMLGNVKGLDGLVKDQKVVVPIGGTVSQPRINRQALEVALKSMGGDVLKKQLSGQASGLLDKLGLPGEAGGQGQGGDLKGGIENKLRGLIPNLGGKP